MGSVRGFNVHFSDDSDVLHLFRHSLSIRVASLMKRLFKSYVGGPLGGRGGAGRAALTIAF